ncbi:alpha-L RNA-binding motif-containing protein [Sistotremastrum niveocremeum HHB9708]|uniref:Alpha-L RNA-binding motif-containing protein n=1 Tax=Sistotremastrum niveocremeum HHB9708 TaxID=1314777 RepID=A0A164QHX1_9AGAM|nr:alpha-L RNA-binding motif-containing protein [Sistotremastrum niveocremeum HHB9708]
MRDANVLGHTRALPRMSWSPHNLFNLISRTVGKKASEARFNRTSQSLFQQRWLSKRLLRAYHGDHIPEKIFKRWYLPQTIPDVRPRKATANLRGGRNDDLGTDTWRMSRRAQELEKARRRDVEEQKLAPVGSLMWAEVERRIDVFIFRCCFAHSVWEARRLVVHGNVRLNGVLHQNANTRLAPGDVVSVDPSAIRFLQKPPELSSPENTSSPSDSSTTSADSETPSTPPSSTSTSDPSPSSTSEAQSATPTPPSPSQKTITPTPSAYLTTLTPFHPPPYISPFIFIPAYIEPSFATCSAIYLRHPTARSGYSEIATPYEADGEVMRCAWEWYVATRPRMRSARKLREGPENRVG